MTRCTRPFDPLSTGWRLGDCQPLIDRGVLRFTDHRPALTDNARRCILRAFNLDRDSACSPTF
jgi:hypothetical protein